MGNTNYFIAPYDIPLLAYVIGLLIVWTIGISFIPRSWENKEIRWASFAASGSFFGNCIILWYYFEPKELDFQHSFEIPLIPEYNLVLSFGLDGISMTFLLLTAFIIPFCLSALGTVSINYKQFVICILLVEIFLVLSFCTTNLFFFFIFFEAVLIPMYLIVGIWGGRNRKINASYYFFLYTLFGSFFLLYGILSVFTIVESFEYDDILNVLFLVDDQLILFFFFFLPFAIKIPMFPFHLWLPEAHVEAPTTGSVILASLLLKLGGYGFLRFTLPMFPAGCLYAQPFVMALALLGVIFASCSAIRQSDLKRIIAYSSIAHMNLVVLGLFSFTHQGIDGAMYLMIGHGIVSAALFLCVGDLYDRYHTRLMRYFGGLVRVMPLFSTVFFVFTLANMGFPGTSNFVGELLVFVALFELNTGLSAWSCISIFLSAIYSIWVYNRICFGTLKNEKEVADAHADLNDVSLSQFIILMIAMLCLGVYSECITTLTYWPILKILGRF